MIFLKKYDVIQLVAVVKSLLNCEFEESTDKESKNIVANILKLLIKLCLLLYLRKIL